MLPGLEPDELASVHAELRRHLVNPRKKQPAKKKPVKKEPAKKRPTKQKIVWKNDISQGFNTST